MLFRFYGEVSVLKKMDDNSFETPHPSQVIVMYKSIQDCSYQDEASNVPTAFSGLWSSKKLEKFKCNKINFCFFNLKFFLKISPHTPY